MTMTPICSQVDRTYSTEALETLNVEPLAGVVVLRAVAFSTIGTSPLKQPLVERAHVVVVVGDEAVDRHHVVHDHGSHRVSFGVRAMLS